MFSDHDGITSEIHSRNIARKIPKYLETNILKKKKICESKKDKRQYRKYFQLNKDESTCLNLWDASKIVLGGDIRTLAYSRKNEKAHINDLGFHLK